MLTASPLLVESVLHSPGTLLVGDPQVLAQLELPAASSFDPSTTGVWPTAASGVPARTSGSGGVSGIVPTPAGNTFVLLNLGAPAETSGFGGVSNAVVISAKSSVFVWVAGSSEVASLTVTTHPDPLERELTVLGHVDCPSGRIVVGTPEAVAAWGTEIQPDDGLLAQARAYRPDRRLCGHVVVARLVPGRHRVLGITGDEHLDGVIVDCESAADTGGMGHLLIAS